MLRTMTRGPYLLDADIRELGGIASAAELLDLGYTRDALRLWGDGRRSRRLRRGWYGLRDLPEEVVAAWAAGGSLACISALEMAARRERLGDPESPAARAPAPAAAARAPAARVDRAALHICVPTTAARIPRTAAMYGRTVPIIVHWSTADFRAGTRASVTSTTAERQVRRCERRAPQAQGGGSRVTDP